MYCRKCMRKDPEKKINMKIDLEKSCYVCPECNDIIYWSTAKEDG